MGFRFGKRIKLAPGVRLNLGLRGASLSMGPRGATVNVGPRGVFGTVGLPGTGLSYRTRLAGRQAQGREVPPVIALPANLAFAFGPTEELVLSGGGGLLSAEQVAEARRQRAPQIQAVLDSRAGDLNAETAIIANIHAGTPGPAPRLSGGRGPPPSPPPAVDEPGVSSAERARRAGDWEIHEALLRRWMLSNGLPTADQVVRQLEARLARVSWPRETVVDIDISPNGLEARLDIDLPEIEELPDVEARANGRALRIDLKPLSRAAKRKLYARHVHGLLLRIAGEVFAEPSPVQRVTLSGFSQRLKGAVMKDVYILSVRIEHEAWDRLDFQALAARDPEVLIGQFSPRRSMAADGNLGSIIPFD